MSDKLVIKNGAIIESLSNETVALDIQGVNGQLFSITDNLTGDIFEVSDISGMPIMTVNSNGTVTIDGSLVLTSGTISATLANTLTRGSYLTGSDYNGSATTTWAVDATTSATANKIVARDSNGNIYGVYINSSRSNESSAAASYIYDTGDGWMRKKTLANTQTEIVTSAAVIAGLGYTPYNSTNPNGYTTNTGTVTSIATSGAILGGTITTSGTISHSTASGYKHVPSGGSSGQFLGWSSDGTAAWVNNPDTNTWRSISDVYITNDSSISISSAWAYAHMTANNPHGLIASDIGAAYDTHTHGNITNAGAIGSTSGLMVKTTTSGVLTTLAAGSSGQFLRYDGTWATPSYTSSLAWTSITSTPTTISGYGITDAFSSGGGVLTGGIEIQNVINGSSYASSEGYYTGENNIILRGDATYGKSGILFTSSKGTTSINQPSDKGFIQFQSYGGTATTGESNKLVIGVGNDSDDNVIIQTPSSTGFKHVTPGGTEYTVWDAGNLTNLNQLTNGPGYISANQTITLSGVITGSGTTAITTAIADGALSIAKTSGLQTTLNNKVGTSDTLLYFGIGGIPTGLVMGNTVQFNAGTNVSLSQNTSSGVSTITINANDTSVAWSELTSVPSTFTPSSHTHGNITNAGAIGSTSGLMVKTTTSGVLTTLEAGTSGQFLTYNGTWATPSYTTSLAWSSITSKPSTISGYGITDAITTTNNSSLESDSRNTRGVTRLYRRDDNSDYSVQTYWSGTRWRLYGYNGDNSHADTEVGYANSAGSVTNSIEFNNSGSGAGSGSTFNGSGTITVSYNTIGAAASSHTHSYLPLGGGTLTGDLTLQYTFPRINLTDTDNNSDYSIINNNGTFGIYDSTNSSYRLNINSSGYVGIGVTPDTTYKLQVSGSIYASSDIYAYSDQSVKTNLEVISNSIEKIKQINGYTFNRIDFESDKRYAGVIAQEVEKILPEVINMNEDGTKSVAYGNIVALLIEAIKEQQLEIEELKKMIR